MNEIKKEDITILKFLDKYFKASESIGDWYISQLQNYDHKAIENYIFTNYLKSIGFTDEQCENLKLEYEKFEIDYSQSIIEVQVEEESTNQETTSINLDEFTEEDFKNSDLNGLLYTFFGDNGKSIIDWLIPQQYNGGAKIAMNYIFNEYLPSGGWDSDKINLLKKALYDLILETKASLEVSIENVPEVSTENKEVEKDASQIMESNILQQVEVAVEETQVEQTIPQEYQNDAISTVHLIRELEKNIEDQLNKVMLLKEPYKIGNSYVNDNYKHCPSFKNLLKPIQHAIIKRREQKVNEKWFEKYRPELVEEILFPNNVIKETIHQYVNNKHIEGNCMFYGTGGVGKTTTNIVLMNSILENVADRFFLDRKIESVDELKGWLNKKPMGKQKIVIAEEFDRLSDAAMTELKNGLMEKYEYVVFLASTNKIHKIDEALLTRFTLISKFETAQIEDITNKCRYILTNERVRFTEEDLKYFVDQNKLKGIRTILNNLQLSCYMGVFEPKRTAFFIGDSGTEYDMITWVKWYINYLIQLNKEQLWYLSYDLNRDQNIAKIRHAMVETLVSNYSINYDYIFMELLKDNIFLPIKNCINMYYQDIDVKRIKSMHFEAMLNDFINILYTTKDIYNR
jgi:DNA polymerase III delta prime subunit